MRLENKKEIDFFKLLNRFRAHWSISYSKTGGAPQRSVSKAAFSTWQGYEEAKPELAKEQQQFLLNRGNTRVDLDRGIHHRNARLYTKQTDRKALKPT